MAGGRIHNRDVRVKGRSESATFPERKKAPVRRIVPPRQWDQADCGGPVYGLFYQLQDPEILGSLHGLQAVPGIQLLEEMVDVAFGSAQT